MRLGDSTKYNRLFNAGFLILAAVIVCLLASKPAYNWDMLGYMGVVEEYSENNIDSVQQRVYRQLQAQTPRDVYEHLAFRKGQYVERFRNADLFNEALGYYRTKPLYTFVVFVLNMCGVPLVLATIIPSVVSAFGLIVLFYFWLCDYLVRPLSVVFGALVTITPGFVELVRLSTPDAMSNLFLLSTLFMVYKQKSGWPVNVLLIAAVLTRIDNVLFAVVVLTFMHWTKIKRNIFWFVGLGVALVTALIVVPVMLGNRWDWFMQFGFLHSANRFWYHIGLMVKMFFEVQYVLLTVVAALVLRFGGADVKWFVGVAVFSVLLHLALFPSLQERFFFAFELVVLLMLFQTLSPGQKISETAKPSSAI